jgi:hypothetical protein
MRALIALAMLAGCGGAEPARRGTTPRATPPPPTLIAAEAPIELPDFPGLLLRIATPAEAAPDGAEELARARTLYRDLRFDESLAAVGEIQQRLESSARTGDDFELLRLSLLLRGMNELALSREDRAREAFRSAVALRPDAELDAAYPPDVRELHATVRTELRADPPVSVVLSTAPPGAEVMLDGRPIGVSPVSLNATPGRHYVRVEAVGHEPRTLPVDLREGAAPIEVPLPEAEAALVLRQLAALEPAELARIPESTREHIARELEVGRLLAVAARDAQVELALLDLRSGEVARRAGPAAELDRLVRELHFPVGSDEHEEPRTPARRSPWLWTVLGIVLVGGGVTAAVLLTRDPGQEAILNPSPR